MTDDVLIGKFGRPHGVRGEVRFFGYNPESELLAPGLVLDLHDCALDSVTVTRARPAKKFSIVAVDEISDRDEAALLRNVEASVPRDALPSIDDDEFYLVDVIGFDAVELTDESRRVVGEVAGWLENTPTDVMVVESDDLPRRLLVPYVDHVVETIDFEGERVVLRPFDEWAPAEPSEEQE